MHKQCHKEDPAQELLHVLKGNSLQVFSVPSFVPEALMLAFFSLFLEDVSKSFLKICMRKFAW